MKHDEIARRLREEFPVEEIERMFNRPNFVSRLIDEIRGARCGKPTQPPAGYVAPCILEAGHEGPCK